ncbi:MAG TPA: superoxide dismutase family protein [Chloroflexota bacterium]|nr:superoxide dismutase family protein [Chloroflexota bacterium]
MRITARSSATVAPGHGPHVRVLGALAGAGLAAALLTGEALAQQPPAPALARAEVRNQQGAVLGTATFTQTRDGVAIAGELRGLPPGLHGIHLHETGRCEAPFTSAGAHFNPAGAQHGIRNPQGAHTGDVVNLADLDVGSNLLVTPNGTATLRFLAREATLGPGRLSVFDADGSALVIHAAEDDNITDPTGNSGDRIACGVLVAAAQVPGALPRTGQPTAVLPGAVPAALGALVVAAGGLLTLASRRRR